MSRSRIKIFVFMYNEEALLPFFLSHYHYVDTIHAVVSKSTDRTLDILKEAQRLGKCEFIELPEIIIEPFEFPNGMNDFLKRDKMNELVSAPDLKHDWFFALDADEFIWPSPESRRTCSQTYGEDCRKVRHFLQSVPNEASYCIARMWNVYRHHSDSDLNHNCHPVVMQRRHGIPDRSGGENAQYQKPIVIRPNRGLRFDLGNHQLATQSLYSPTWSFDGAHWQNADPSFAIKRRCADRRDRQSPENRQYGLGSQHHHITEADVLAICEAHKNDPQVF